MARVLSELARAAAGMGLRECVILLSLLMALACWLEGMDCVLFGGRARLWWWLELAFCAGAVAAAWM